MTKKILVVDDDELTVRLLRSRLEAAGYNVLEAASGKMSVEIAGKECPDILIMDIMLPDMLGSDAVKAMQEDDEISKMKIIFLSGIISKTDESGQQVQVGGQFYPAVAKPIDFDRLATFISE